MSHRHLTDPSLASVNHAALPSNNPITLLNEHGPRRPTDPVELRQLLLDYLCHQCFVDTASAFARESASHVAVHHPEVVNGSARLTPSPALIKGPHSPVAVKDTVVERTVRFDTDDDGDAEMGDLTTSTHDNLVSNITGLASSIDGAQPGVVNGSSPSLTRNGAKETDLNCDPPPWPTRTESYPDWTAQDIQTTRARLAIKEHIVGGRVKEALKLIESHFPAVLGPSLISKPANAASPGNATNAKTTKALRSKPNRVSFTTRPLSTGSPTGTPKSSNSQAGPNASQLRQSLYKWVEPGTGTNTAPTGGAHQFPHAIFGSLDPAHIALNLQIQFFVEFVRSISQTHGPLNGGEPEDGPGAGWDGAQRNGKGAEHGRKLGASDLAGSVGALSDDTSTTSSSVSTRTTSLALSLPHCRALHDFVHQLPDPLERAVFAKELENVAGLLAYVDPWDSPVKKYLDQSRRDTLAERVNAAILVHLGRSPTSILQLIGQQTCFTWATLNEIGERVPCPTPDDKSRTKPSNFFNLTEFVNLHELGDP